MERQKKHGVFYSFLLGMFLYGVCLTNPAQAGVQLLPRVNTQGQIQQNDAGGTIASED